MRCLAQPSKPGAEELIFFNFKGLEISGSVLVNGEDVGASMSDLSAYVQQNDVFIGCLTVIGKLIFIYFFSFL